MEVPSEQTIVDKALVTGALDSPRPLRGCSTERVLAQQGKSTLDAMADAYSIRARRARELQGLPPVVTSPSALGHLASLMATAKPQTPSVGADNGHDAA